MNALMQRRAAHVEWLHRLFDRMQAVGFANIHIDDDDLDRLSVHQHGADAVIREMFQVDDMVMLTAEFPRAGDVAPYDEPHRTHLYFLLCNAPWESLADYSIPCERVDELLTQILDELGPKE